MERRGEAGKEGKRGDRRKSSEVKEDRRGKRSRDGNKGFGRNLKIEKSEEEVVRRIKKNKDARILAGI